MDNKKHKIICMLLFMVPGIFASFIVSLFVSGVIAGVFWLFIFGDNPWPDWVDLFIPLCFGLIFLFSVMGFSYAGYKAADKNSDISRKHVVLSIGVSFVLIAIIVLNSFKGEIQLHMTDPLVSECMALCSERGYNGSSTSPKNSEIRECSCFDDTVNEWMVIQQNSDEWRTNEP